MGLFSFIGSVVVHWVCCNLYFTQNVVSCIMFVAVHLIFVSFFGSVVVNFIGSVLGSIGSVVVH